MNKIITVACCLIMGCSLNRNIPHSVTQYDEKSSVQNIDKLKSIFYKAVPKWDEEKQSIIIQASLSDVYGSAIWKD